MFDLIPEFLNTSTNPEHQRFRNRGTRSNNVNVTQYKYKGSVTNDKNCH